MLPRLGHHRRGLEQDAEIAQGRVQAHVTLGLTLLGGEGISAAMLAAAFLSNLPESMAATTGFEKSGRSSA